MRVDGERRRLLHVLALQASRSSLKHLSSCRERNRGFGLPGRVGAASQPCPELAEERTKLARRRVTFYPANPGASYLVRHTGSVVERSVVRPSQIQRIRLQDRLSPVDRTAERFRLRPRSLASGVEGGRLGRPDRAGHAATRLLSHFHLSRDRCRWQVVGGDLEGGEGGVLPIPILARGGERRVSSRGGARRLNPKWSWLLPGSGGSRSTSSLVPVGQAVAGSSSRRAW